MNALIELAVLDEAFGVDVDVDGVAPPSVCPGDPDAPYPQIVSLIIEIGSSTLTIVYSDGRKERNAKPV